MMIQRKSFIALAITAALAAPAAVAQTGTPPEKQPAVGSEGTSKAPARQPEGARNPIDRTGDTGALTFRSLDANKDGFVSRDEAKNSSELNRQFGSLDRDGDGKLSPQELGSFQAGSPSPAGSMGQDRVGASGSSGVGTSTEPSGGTRPGGNRPPETPKKSY